MKQQWIDALRVAALDGTVQTFFLLSEDGTKRCAMGVLLDALSGGQGWEDWKESGLLELARCSFVVRSSSGEIEIMGERRTWVFSDKTKKELGATGTAECPLCPGSFSPETMLVMHLNDMHKMDFLTIANKLPVTPE